MQRRSVPARTLTYFGPNFRFAPPKIPPSSGGHLDGSPPPPTPIPNSHGPFFQRFHHLPPPVSYPPGSGPDLGGFSGPPLKNSLPVSSGPSPDSPGSFGGRTGLYGPFGSF